jgi:hypothetical protein
MTVTSDSYEAKVSEAAVLLLATCATFQTLTATVTPTAAKAFIVEDWSGTQDDGSGTAFKACDGSTINDAGLWAYVRTLGTTTEQRAMNTWGQSGAVLFLISVPIQSADTPSEVVRRARNAQGSIKAEMRAQIGGATTFAWADFETPEVVIGDDTGSGRGSVTITVEMTWRDIP